MNLRNMLVNMFTKVRDAFTAEDIEKVEQSARDDFDYLFGTYRDAFNERAQEVMGTTETRFLGLEGLDVAMSDEVVDADYEHKGLTDETNGVAAQQGPTEDTEDLTMTPYEERSAKELKAECQLRDIKLSSKDRKKAAMIKKLKADDRKKAKK